MINQKFEIEKTTDRGYVLWIDEKPSICPYCPPIMVPGQIPGTATMMRMPCSTQCPMAKITDGYKMNQSNERESCQVYITHCGSKSIERVIAEKEAPQQPQSGILKSL